MADLKCFKCDRPIGGATVGADPWDMPRRAVHFRGGTNFGSTIYDAMADGIYVEIVVCDDCLTAASIDATKLRDVTLVDQTSHFVPVPARPTTPVES